MFDRLNYSIDDFLLFSPRVYDRMFELHNLAVWPAHAITIAIGLFLLAVAFRPNPHAVRGAFALLALAWSFVAIAFFAMRYASINWAALYVSPLFALMALVLVFFAVRPRPPVLSAGALMPRVIGVGVLLFSLVGYPLLGHLTGKPWQGAQVFGIAPDPTIMATLGFLTLCTGSGVLAAMIIPALWAMATGLTLYALDRPEFVAAPVAAALCFTAHLAGSGFRSHRLSDHESSD